jgi:hypothetical protein
LYEYRKNPENVEYIHPRFKRQKDFEATIKKIASFFFYKKQAYAEPSYQALLNRWQKLWFNADTTALDIATAQHEIMWGNESSYTSQAAMALLEFYEEFSNKPQQQVILSDEPFSVPFGKGIVFTGVFDLVLREKSQLVDKYTIYKWSGYQKRMTMDSWMFDFAMLDYAFNYRNNFKKLDVEFKLWDFGSIQPGSIHYEMTENDKVALQYWASRLGRTEVFVPKRGLISYCKQCPFDTPCSKWQFPVAVKK